MKQRKIGWVLFCIAAWRSGVTWIPQTSQGKPSYFLSKDVYDFIYVREILNSIPVKRGYNIVLATEIWNQTFVQQKKNVKK